MSLYCLKTEILLSVSTERDTLAAHADTMAHQVAEQAVSGAVAKLDTEFQYLLFWWEQEE